MKKHIWLGIACMATTVLTGCASHNNKYYKAQVRNDLVQENWIYHVNSDTTTWTAHADKWFLTDEPRTFNEFDSNAPTSQAITAMTVRVPDFTNIRVDGPYRVQIYGGQLHNTLYVLGPNESARHTAVDINGNTLYIHPATECKRSCGNLTDVIIRIGVHDLNHLEANGTGLIEGKLITSSDLRVKSTNKNEIILAGQMTLRRVFQASAAPITIMGVYSPELDIKVMNSGNVNVSGRIGIRTITKQSSGSLNIMGADSDAVYIHSSGTGITNIKGNIDLKKVDVRDASRVYAYWVSSNGIYASVSGDARLGLAGSAHNLDIDVYGNARFEGKYLRTDTIYVRTNEYSHANVTPRYKLFASANNNSSIYFFGSPNVVSRYTTGNGMVIPVFNDACQIPAAPEPAVSNQALFKDEPPVTNTYAPAPTPVSNTRAPSHYPRHNYKAEGSFRH